ncbi:MAG: tetratricopeptide repeat protein [Candidatus Melainabacteria bacterium]|nr:tetratricopeptide repeat protein [Candidatus Melainabacteria bacterium]
MSQFSLFRLNVESVAPDVPLACGRLFGAVLLGWLACHVALQPAWAEPEEQVTLRAQTSKSTQWVDPTPLKGQKPYQEKHPLIIKADALVAAYQLQAAEKLYLQVMQQNPKQPGSHNGLGKVYWYLSGSESPAVDGQQANLQAKAIDQFLTTIRLAPTHVEARVNLARLYMGQQRWRDAQEELVYALTVNPYHPEANLRLGQVLTARGQHDKAREFLAYAQYLKPQLDGLRYQQGVLESTVGNQQAAYEQLQLAAKAQPNNPDVHYQLGRLYQLMDRPASALESFKRSIALKPSHRPAREALAEHYKMRQDWAHALEQYQTLVEMDSEDAVARENLAEVALANRQPELAQQHLEAILIRQPENTEIRRRLAEVETQLGKTLSQTGYLADEVAAHAWLERSANGFQDGLDSRLVAVKLNGGPRSLEDWDAGVLAATLREPAQSVNQLVTQGEMLTASQRHAEATQTYRRAIETAASVKDLATLGEILLNLAQPGLAEEAFRKIQGREPANRLAQRGLLHAERALRVSETLLAEAYLHEKAKHWNEAIDRLEAALAKNAHHAEAHYALARILEHQQRLEEACLHYEAALSLNTANAWAQRARERLQKLSQQVLKQRIGLR